MGHSDGQKPLVSGADQRSAVRVVYETLVMVAEYPGPDFPPFSAFWEVKTRDLSPTGIGFSSPRKPVGADLLLLFGNPQANPIFVKARVAHCVESKTPQGKVYIVGCQLVERLTK